MQYYRADIPVVQINTITIREIILRKHAENKKGFSHLKYRFNTSTRLLQPGRGSFILSPGEKL